MCCVRSRKEANRLALEKRQIQEAHENLLRVNEKLEKNESTWKYQADSAKYEVDIIRNQVTFFCSGSVIQCFYSH